jgi:hypothetical protein
MTLTHAVPPEHVADLAHLLEALGLYLRLDLAPAPPRLRVSGTQVEVDPPAAATHDWLAPLAPDAHAMRALPLQMVARLAVAQEQKHQRLTVGRVLLQSLKRRVESWKVVAVRSHPLLLALRELDLQRQVD